MRQTELKAVERGQSFSCHTSMTGRMIASIMQIAAIIMSICFVAPSQKVYAQAARVDIPLLTSGPNVPFKPGPLPQALWVANATAYLCAHPSATLAACQASPITTYTDSTEGTTCPSTAQLVQLPGNTCTAVTGAAANIGAWVSQGIFDYWVISAYGSYGPYTFYPPGGGCQGSNDVSHGCTGATTAAGAAANLTGNQSVICTNTAADQTALQSALDAAGAGTAPRLIFVTGAPSSSGPTCLSATTPGLVVYSGTRIYSSGGEVTFVTPLGATPNTEYTTPSSFGVGITNWANTQTPRSSAGASMTAGSTTLTLIDSSCAVNQTVLVPNGLAMSYVAVGGRTIPAQGMWSIVESCTDPNHAVLKNKALVSTGTVTVLFYLRDHDILIDGLRSNLETNNQFNFWVAHIDNFTGTNLSCQSTLGNPFCFLGEDINNLRISGLNGLGIEADLFHIHGPADNFEADGLYCGFCKSDIVSLTAVDYTEFAYTWGNIHHGTVKNTHNYDVPSGSSAGGVYVASGANTFVGDLHFQDIYDKSTGGGIDVITMVEELPSAQAFPGPTNCDGPITIDGVYSYKSVIIAPQACDSVTITNVIPPNGPATGSGAPVVLGAGDGTNTQISDVEVSNVILGPGTTGWGQLLAANVGTGATTVLNKIGLHNSHYESAYNSGSLYVLGANSSGTTTIGSFNESGNSIRWNNTGFNVCARNIIGYSSGSSNSTTVGNITSSGDTVQAVNAGASGSSAYVGPYANVSNWQLVNENYLCQTTGGDLINVDSLGTLTHYTIVAPNVQKCGDVINLTSGAAASSGEIVGGILNGTSRVGNWTNTQTESITLSGVNLSSLASNAINVSGATLTIHGDGLNPSGSGGIDRVASETVYDTNPSFPVDIAQLAHQSGDLAYNANIASGPFGPVEDTGTAWSSIGTSSIFTGPDLLVGDGNFETGTTYVGTDFTSYCDTGSGNITCSFLRDSSWAVLGTYSQKMTVLTNTGANYGIAVYSTGKTFPVTAGQIVSVSGYAKSSGGSINSLNIYLINVSGVNSLCSWYNTGGRYTVTGLTTTPISFAESCLVTGSGTVKLEIAPVPTAGLTGSVWVDDVVITVAGTMLPGTLVGSTGPTSIGNVAVGSTLPYSISGNSGTTNALATNGTGTQSWSMSGGVQGWNNQAAQVAANLASSGSTGVTGILPSANGGTGVANTGVTETFAANFTTTGSGAPTLAFPATTPYTYTYPAYTGTMLEETASDTTPTHVLHASSTIGVGTYGAIAAGELPAALSSSSSINKVTMTAPATGSTLTIADGKTLTATNTMDVAKTAGVAGGVPWYDTTGSMSASALLAQYGIVIGGGASAAPSTIIPGAWTTGHTFIPAWVALGSALAPTAVDANTLAVASAGTAGTLTTALAANQVLGSLTAVAPTGLTMPSCSTAASALLWTSGTGYSCNTSITANTAGTAMTATNATNVATTGGSSSASTFYPTFFASNSSGNQAATTTSALNFVPSTGMLSATGFTGALTGNASTSTTAANLSGTPALPNGTTATTQAANSADTKLATDNTVINSYATPPTAGYGSTTAEPVAATTVTASTSIASPHILNGATGSNAPTCTVTGAGSSATCTAWASMNSTDSDGVFYITSSGTGQAANGTITLTFHAALGANEAICTATPTDQANAWSFPASIHLKTASTTSPILNWNNNSVVLVAANLYYFSYHCFGN